LAEVTVAPGLSGEYVGVQLVRITFENGQAVGLSLVDDLTIETDHQGRVYARPSKIEPIMAVVGLPSAVLTGPAGKIIV
jgi:hypothetical protein